MRTPAVLVVLDGYGLRDERDGNAIAHAETPNLSSLFQQSFARLDASGEAVGLPAGMMGSSEVGHLNIGAGRVVKQEVTLINEAISDGSFFENPTLLDTVDQADGNDVHIMGLLSDEGVHAHTDHLYALLAFYAQHDITPKIHAFTDGRDTAPKAARQYFEALEEEMERYDGELATIMGRYYGMDRDENWKRTRRAFEAINDGTGKEVESWKECLRDAYHEGETDEFITPRVLDHDGITEGDVLICYNYRTDRPRQLTKAFVEDGFDKFPRDHTELNFTGMVAYYDDMPAPHLYEKVHPKRGLGQYLSEQGYTQYRLAETEKYAHVTYFFNGEVEEPFDGEERIVTDSPDVATYDEEPKMAAEAITDNAVEILEDTDVVIMNFANCDMVGHTGDFDAAVTAVETVDRCIGRIVDAVQAHDGILLLTADHGNAELMRRDGDRVTSHTTAQVPITVAGEDVALRDGILADVAPTFLTVAGEDVPEEMTGDVLVQ